MQDSKFTAEERLDILRQAQGGVSVAQICEEHGISRTLFYRWKARYEQEGLQGLSVRPPVHTGNALRTSADIVNAIVWAARDHPYLTCRALAERVSATSLSVSFSQVQKILRAHDLATPEQRWLAVEDAFRKGYSKFSKKTLAFTVEKNPSFRERHLRTFRPREHLTATTFALPQSRFRGQTLVAVIDAYSSFAYVGSARHHHDAYRIIEEGLDRFSALDSTVSYLFTDRSAAFNYRNADLARILRRFAVQHVASEVPPRGFTDSLRRWLVTRLREPGAAASSLSELVADYNLQHAPLGFPNYGITPAAIFINGVSTRIEHKPAQTVKRR